MHKIFHSVALSLLAASLSAVVLLMLIDDDFQFFHYPKTMQQDFMVGC